MKTLTAKLAIKLSLGAIALGVCMAAQAADVSEYGVLKGRQPYVQSDAATPGDDFIFYWLSPYVRMTATDSVTEATVLPPGAEDPLPLVPAGRSVTAATEPSRAVSVRPEHGVPQRGLRRGHGHGARRQPQRHTAA